MTAKLEKDDYNAAMLVRRAKNVSHNAKTARDHRCAPAVSRRIAPIRAGASLILAAAWVACESPPRAHPPATPESSRSLLTPAPAPESARFAAVQGCPPSRHEFWKGEFRDAAWLAHWAPQARLDYGDINLELVPNEKFGNVLRVHYPKGSSSSSFAREGNPLGGAEFKAKFPDSAKLESIYFSYWIFFDQGFQFVKGGKLPGVCGGSCPSGGAVVTGEGGWSMRYMWRPGGAGEEYGYILPDTHNYGTELGLGSWTFTTGEWHHLAEEIILNAPGRADGVLRVWFDRAPTATPTFEATNLTYRNDTTPVSALFFSTFFGGHDASWASPKDTYVDFARFEVCR